MEIKLYKYIGDTVRSIYERGLEHIRDFRELTKDSHMIKHYFANLGMMHLRILNSTKEIKLRT